MIIKHYLAGSTSGYSESDSYVWNQKSYFRKNNGRLWSIFEKINTNLVSSPVSIRPLNFPGLPVFLPGQKRTDPSFIPLGKKKKKGKILSLFCLFGSMSEAYAGCPFWHPSTKWSMKSGNGTIDTEVQHCKSRCWCKETMAISQRIYKPLLPEYCHCRK